MAVKLSVSNIAWNPAEEKEVLDLLSRYGVSGIEIAPTKFWPEWQGADAESARYIRKELASKGFEVPALQAILFGKSELQVFSEPDMQAKLISHIDEVAALADALDARILVFGSPRNRDPGDRSDEQAFSEAVDFFRRAGEICVKHNVQLCIEPNPAVYHCNFMTHWHEVAAMVSAVSHPGIGLHLDAACIFIEGDDVIRAIHESADNIVHFHVTEPDLGDFSNPRLDHVAIGKALKEINYAGWISIEMRRSDNPVKSIEEAVTRVNEWYA